MTEENIKTEGNEMQEPPGEGTIRGRLSCERRDMADEIKEMDSNGTTGNPDAAAKVETGEESSKAGSVSSSLPLIILPILLIASIGVSIAGLGQALDKVFVLGGEGAYFVKHLEYGFEAYFSQHKRYPEVAAWCDALKQDPESSDYFRYESECEFAVNQHLSEAEGQVPADMVVLFDAPPGWNQSGGPELARGYKGSVYARVITGDWTFQTVHIADVPYLRWRPQDSGVIPMVNRTKPCALMASGIVCFATVALITLRKQIKAYPLFTLILGLLSIGAGVFWGGWSESMYALAENKHLGEMAGGAAGLLTGLCFAAVLGKRAERIGPQAGLVGFGGLIGTIFGLLCSCAVHGFLTIAYRETGFVNMAAGAAFGAWTGVILGWIAAAVMGRMRRRAAAVREAVREGAAS
jgi:hypothetical protein